MITIIIPLILPFSQIRCPNQVDRIAQNRVQVMQDWKNFLIVTLTYTNQMFTGFFNHRTLPSPSENVSEISRNFISISTGFEASIMRK